MSSPVVIPIPPALDAITNEAAYQTLVVDALRHLGWVVIHVKEMFGNSKGLPDLLCFRGEQGQMIELKIVGNYLSKGQRNWQERWVPEGTEVLLIRNTDEDWDRLMARMQ